MICCIIATKVVFEQVKGRFREMQTLFLVEKILESV